MNIMNKRFSLILLLSLVTTIMSAQVMKVGIIGLDTSHSTSFTRIINSNDAGNSDFKVVAAYPYGSRTIESAYSRIPKYTEDVKGMGVTIVSSIAELLDMVDCVLLETNDGHLHLEQAAEVFKAGKKVYIDKPIGATLVEAIAIYELAKRYGVTTFSSSAVRFTPLNQEIRNGKHGDVLGADCYSPHHPEASHPDFGYYGLHGVEELYTVMGTGCKEVSRVHTQSGDVVSGIWEGGKIGSFRAIVEGPGSYGGRIITERGVFETGGYVGYKPLLDEILKFFRTGISPVDKEETLEIFTFMEASNLSLQKGGKTVPLEKIRAKAEKEARKLLRGIN